VMACTLEYRSDLFDAASVERMAQHFVQLLQAITQDANTRLGELPWLDGAEHDQLVLGWNDTAVDYGECAGATLHGRFEACARRTPQAVAVVFEDASLTYAELDQQANGLAHQLLALGVRPPTCRSIRSTRLNAWPPCWPMLDPPRC
jgi:non-ribosomal peptide synthetase component F